MEQEILKLRKALVHYEECVDVDAAEHITASALMSLSAACENLQEKCDEIIVDMHK